MNPKGKVALVTGGAVRIGREIVLALAKARCRVVIHYRRSEKAAAQLTRRLNTQRKIAIAVQADLTSTDQIELLAREALSAFDRVDILINNASEFFRTPIGTVSSKDWDRLLNANLRAPFFLSQQLGGQMARRGEGKIINIADISAFHPWIEYLPYCISKAGLVTMTQGLAKAMAPKIQVNAIAPGTILPAVDGWNPRRKRQTLQAIPLKRMGSPEDVVRTVLFLIESDYITGTVIPVDGGRSVV